MRRRCGPWSWLKVRSRRSLRDVNHRLILNVSAEAHRALTVIPLIPDCHRTHGTHLQLDLDASTIEVVIGMTYPANDQPLLMSPEE
jgi:hypothetical protein